MTHPHTELSHLNCLFHAHFIILTWHTQENMLEQWGRIKIPWKFSIPPYLDMVGWTERKQVRLGYARLGGGYVRLS